MPTTVNSQAPDVVNQDGTVTRVVTQTITFTAAEYAYQANSLQQQVINAQNQATTLTAQATAAQTVLAQSQAVVAASIAAQSAQLANPAKT